jgi:hypothetical protein
MIRERKNFSKSILLFLRLATLLLALVLVSPITTKTAMASIGGASKENGDALAFNVKKIRYQVTKAATKKAKGTVTVIGLQKGYNPKSISIPSTVTYKDYKYTVNAVGDNEYEIDEEYDWLFEENEWGTNLTTVTLPSTVKTIYSYAFGKCETLKEIKIPESVTKIGSYAFYQCEELKEIVIPNNVKNIYIATFSGCISLEKVTLPKNLVVIGQDAFYDCNKLKTISVPATTTTIDVGAFSGCTSITSLKVATANKKYKTVSNALLSKDGKTLFTYPCQDDSYTVPEGVTTIESWAFENPALISVTLSDTVTTIGASAFYNCTSLKEVIMGNSVETLGQYAFSMCTSLESIMLPSSVREIGLLAFYKNTSINEVTLNEGLDRILEGAFQGCTALNTFTIPASVKEIADNMFAACPQLKEISVAAGNTNYKAENGMLLTVDGATLIGYPSASGYVTIPSTVQFIGDYAFEGAALTDVVIPETVKGIGVGAFLNCTSLKSARFMSRNTDIMEYGSEWDYYYNSNGMFGNTSDDLVITVPRDPEAPVKPVREQYVSESDYFDAYYEYQMYYDYYAELLLAYSGGNAEVVIE